MVVPSITLRKIARMKKQGQARALVVVLKNASVKDSKKTKKKAASIENMACRRTSMTQKNAFHQIKYTLLQVIQFSG